MIPERLRWLDRGPTRELGDIFTEAGHEIYLVGGSVRDALMGRDSERDLDRDLDFATDARPRETKRLLGGWADQLYSMGERFGTIGALREGVRCEITTFRAEAYVVDSRRPSVTFGDSIEKDLERRDFTVNAMALRIGTGDPLLVDPFGGTRDIVTQTLRTPIGPDVSFSDDPLRMLRLFRFAAELGFQPEPDELAAVSRMKDRLDIVSPERIRDELSKLVVADGAAHALSLMIHSGLADRFIPEIPALAMTVDPDHRHKDVLAHSLAVMAKTDADLVLRLAALFHDVGKPACRRFEGARVTFHHHEVVGARMTRARLRRLRYPKSIIDAVSELVFLHMRAHTFKMGWTDSAVRRYVRDAGDLLPKLNQLARCDVTTRNDRRARRIQRQLDELEERIEELRARERIESLRPPIDGHQVMEYLGIEPGPMVGRVLKVLLDKRIDEGPYDRATAFRIARKLAIEAGIEDPGPHPERALREPDGAGCLPKESSEPRA